MANKFRATTNWPTSPAALMTGLAAVGDYRPPVDIVSGQRFLSGDDELDFILPSRLPIVWLANNGCVLEGGRRVYQST